MKEKGGFLRAGTPAAALLGARTGRTVEPTARRPRSPSAEFRDASPASRRHSHQRLVEFSNARLGQLAQRLLLKMDELVRTGGEAVIVKAGQIPAVASAYFHVVLAPTHRGMGQRNSREARTLCRALDLMAKKEIGAVADLLCQRQKASEKSLADQGSWTRAQFLEFLPPDGMTLVDRDEDLMVQPENEVQVKIKGGSQKGIGYGKGQDYWKGGKGKGKDKCKGKSNKGDGKSLEAWGCAAVSRFRFPFAVGARG